MLEGVGRVWKGWPARGLGLGVCEPVGKGVIPVGSELDWRLSPDLWLVTALAVSYSLPLILLAWASCVASWLPRADGLPTHLEKIRDWAASV